MTSPNKDDAVAGPSHKQSKGRMLRCYACRYKVTTSGRLHPLMPASKSNFTSPEVYGEQQDVATGARKLCRCALNLNDEHELPLLYDSGSEEDEGPNIVEWDRESVSDQNNDDDFWMTFDIEDVQVQNTSTKEDECVSVEENEMDESIENEMQARIGHPTNMDFTWSENFDSFTGQKEIYTRVPGPTYSSHSPADIFCQIWDREFLDKVVKETNEYAWQLISQLSDPDKNNSIPSYMNLWTDTTVEELYKYFAVLIVMSACHRGNISAYWARDMLEMPLFCKIISRNRFILLNKFLHFVNNENLVNSGEDRKISKIKPVIDHCNKKFSDLYIPSQYLSLDESLLLWKGRLSWKQCIRSKAARFGIKSFELCEAVTGYLLQYKIYTGKDTAIHPRPLHGFNNKPAEVVLQLMEKYLDTGHVLVMDSWYNQLPLTRYLKSRRTDVLGTINRRLHDIPDAIKDLDKKKFKRGESIGRHSGDIALVAWHDKKIVTVISTYHQYKMALETRSGQPFLKPVSVQEYNRYMGGVDLKDAKLSSYLMERKRNCKWYMKVFRRLFNVSLLNAFIIYTRNPMYKVYTHRQFRAKVAEELLSRSQSVSSAPSRTVQNSTLTCPRLLPGKHYPEHTDFNDPQNRYKQLRCIRCTALKKRKLVTIRCKLCKVPLCVGKCWEDYHELKKL